MKNKLPSFMSEYNTYGKYVHSNLASKIMQFK